MIESTFPKTVQVQTTNTCMSRCVFCPTGSGMNGQRKSMPWWMCRSIIDQCKSKGVQAIMPFVNNDPLMYDHVLDFGEYCKEIIPETKFIIYTNALRLDEAMSKSLLKLGMSYIHFSVGGASKETYQKVFRLPYYDRVVESIETFIKLSSSTNCDYTVNMTITKDNQHEVQQFIDFWKSKGVPESKIGTHGVVNRNRKFEGCIDNKSQLNKPCSSPFNDLFVDTDGKCILCCEDAKSECIIGDLNTESIEQVWNGVVIKAYRRVHSIGLKGDIDLCKNCTNFR